MVDDDERSGEGELYPQDARDMQGGRSGTGPALTSPCATCRWKHLNVPDPRRPTCEAFPGGIPYEILTAAHSHRDPYPNDRGIRWAPRMD